MALYDAFISYSHAKDKPIAAALQSVVQKLGKPWYRRRALRVFRDDTSLSATPSLWPSIEQALGAVALPDPARLAGGGGLAVGRQGGRLLARAQERRHAADRAHRRRRSPGTTRSATSPGARACRCRRCSPAALRASRNGSTSRAYRDGADPRDARFIELGADFAAAIHGMPKEDLLSQEVRQQRRALTLAWSAAGIAAGPGRRSPAGNGRRRSTPSALRASSSATGAVAAERRATEQKDVAQTQRDLAERNFGIAKNAADHVVFRIAQDLRDVQGMRVESVRRILDAAQAMMDELARAAPDDLQLQRSRAAMLSEFVDTYLGAGDLTRARTAAEESLAIMRKLAAADPGNAGWQRDVSVSLDRSATCGWRRATGRGRWRPTRRASRSCASSPPPIRAMPAGSAT